MTEENNEKLNSYRCRSQFIQVHQNTFKYIRIHSSILEYIQANQNTFKYSRIHSSISEYI